jgi:hypothetical protein
MSRIGRGSVLGGQERVLSASRARLAKAQPSETFRGLRAEVSVHTTNRPSPFLSEDSSLYAGCFGGTNLQTPDNHSPKFSRAAPSHHSRPRRPARSEQLTMAIAGSLSSRNCKTNSWNAQTAAALCDVSSRRGPKSRVRLCPAAPHLADHSVSRGL